MSEKEQKAVCNQCNTSLDEAYNLPLEGRLPCPRCGSLSRTLQINVSDTVEVHDLVKLRHKAPGRKKPLAEIVSGDDLHRDTGIWMELSRVIDWGKNWYEETVTNPATGEITHHTSHPLNQHIGHGSAKYKK